MISKPNQSGKPGELHPFHQLLRPQTIRRPGGRPSIRTIRYSLLPSADRPDGGQHPRSGSDTVIPTLPHQGNRSVPAPFANSQGGSRPSRSGSRAEVPTPPAPSTRVSLP